MKVTIHVFLLSILTCAFLFDCKIDQRISSDKTHRTVLASEDAASCKVASAEPLYAFLFGLVPVFRNPEPIPAPGQTLRVTEVTNWKDYAVTAIGGWAITLVRRTRTIEFCEENLFANNWNPEKVSIDQTLYQMAMTGKAVVHLKSGDPLTQVKILGFDDSSIEVETTVPDPKGGFTDRAFLRDGTTIDGKQIGQDDKEVTIENLEGKKVTIQKSTLHKIDMRVPKTIKEKKNILKTEIARIAFEDPAKK
ncbi:LIC_13076 family protein [Leptospira yasudae]|uniref:Uncharacterized protein n=1 Tax=Leptospira yasudae TaxID=2202201 RepID=A0A6N4QYP0_9LEPT|nr:hypothetical protein [Leptospira yasudae]TGL77002.1 hypothetical protein EHQ77_16305 [Leptospira yasudae]TGL83944.1 hypothetical protein EHQ72_01595 [Leptospira yasudae]TGL89962.1 hypothetical protein EHQ83_00780 [Leptospira yasudae]